MKDSISGKAALLLANLRCNCVADTVQPVSNPLVVELIDAGLVTPVKSATSQTIGGVSIITRYVVINRNPNPHH